MYVSKETGVQIKTLREANGLTQAVLARRAGISQPFLSQIEGGDVEASLDILVAIGNQIGWDYAEQTKVESDFDTRDPSSRKRLREDSKDQATVLRALAAFKGLPDSLKKPITILMEKIGEDYETRRNKVTIDPSMLDKINK